MIIPRDTFGWEYISQSVCLDKLLLPLLDWLEIFYTCSHDQFIHMSFFDQVKPI